MADTLAPLDRKFIGDSAWTYGAFAVMAGTGLVLNFFIAGYFGTTTLGVFNQIYAVYVVCAQLAVFGVHDSVQKYVAEHADQPQTRASICLSAVLLALSIGLLTAVLIYGLSAEIGRLASSPAVGAGLALAAPGLVLFALNKVLLGILNGERRMKAFALAQVTRVLSILAFTGGVAISGGPESALGAGFSIAELVIIGPVLIITRPWSGGAMADFKSWLGRHWRFGCRAIANGFLAESYIRVDVIMLGLFVSDHEVGLYSFAALFIEGLYQVPVVIRTVVNPILVRLILAGHPLALARFSRRIMALSMAVFIPIGLAVVFLFPVLAPFFPDGLVRDSYPVLITVLAGLAVYAAFIAVDFSLLQGGMPGRQSLLMTGNILINVILNASLIPLMGIHGAALATALAFIASSLTLNTAAHHWLGLRGGFLFFGLRQR